MFIPDRAKYFRATRVSGSNSTTIQWFNFLPAEHVEASPAVSYDSGIQKVSELVSVMSNIDNQYIAERDEAISNVVQIMREKQPRYQDATGDDWIDECERTMTWEEFIGAMKFTIGKYLRRLGKKDHELQELEKIADYADRALAAAKRRYSKIDEKV